MLHSATSIGHRPEGPWVFDEEVSRVFEDMLRRSIPQYEAMRGLVFEVGKRFVQPGTDVVDLGCSRGEALAPFVRAFGPAVRYVGVEVSPPMIDVCRNTFASQIEAGMMDVLSLDLCHDYPAVEASLTLSVLTLQFTPLEYRPRIVQDAYDRTVSGGAFVLVEKVLGGSAGGNELLDWTSTTTSSGRTATDRKRSTASVSASRGSSCP